MHFTRLACLFAILPSVFLSAQQIQISKENKTIAITTSEDASELADIAVVTIGFNSYGDNQENTYSNATNISNAIINALSSSGISKAAIQSTEQSLSPINPGSEDDKIRYRQGQRFYFSQRWQVTVSAAQASTVLQLAITSGANNSGGIDWQLQRDDALQAEAARKALEHARQIATSMAQGLGSKLGGLVYASNQTPPRGIFANTELFTLNTESASVAALRVNLKPLAISPARITKTATVYAVFAIE
jgi:uncharacterized protein YggE